MEACPPSRRCRQRGRVFLDARGGDRALRVSWHHEAGVVVLSLWRGERLHRARSGSPSTRCPT